MANEDWKLQVSIRTSASKDSDMINIRANTADELSVLLEGISDFSTQIAATAKMVQGAYAVSPLGTTGSTQGTTPGVTSSTAQPAPQSNTGGLSSPTCIHGTRIWRSGISNKTGKPYAFWSCPLPQGPEQCKATN